MIASHYPRPPAGRALPPASPAACEKALAEWFGAPVILLASGRSGLDLYLRAKGFSRYRHRVQVPPYLARCVINALTPTTFPVDVVQPADAILYYHQYGFTQRTHPAARVVVEDIAHAFFVTPDTGAREWAGEAAVFSLPKSFAIAGSAGGLVIRDAAVEDRIRTMLDRAPAEPAGTRDWMRRVIAGALDDEGADTPNRPLLGSAYELLLAFPRPDAGDLAGLPESVDGMARVGRDRSEAVRLLRRRLGQRAAPPEFWPGDEALLPFAVPYFGDGDPARLSRIDRALDDAGVRAGVYHVDVRRDMTRPEYRPCVLLPCHQALGLARIEEICRLVEATERGR